MCAGSNQHRADHSWRSWGRSGEFLNQPFLNFKCMSNNEMINFGFCSWDSFMQSLIRPEMAKANITLSATIGMCEFLFGIKPMVLIAFVALLTLELFSGIMASLLEGRRITSRRMRSFGVMMIIWLIALFIVHQFKVHFSGLYVESIFNYLFVVIILYANAVYFKSIWENAARISGSMRHKDLFKKMSEKFGDKLTK